MHAGHALCAEGSACNHASAASADVFASSPQVHRLRGSFLEEREGEGEGEESGDEKNEMHGGEMLSAECARRVLPATGEFVAEAAQCMRGGGVVALPTDTLYGLAALGTADEAINRIYDVKGRDTKVRRAGGCVNIVYLGDS